MLHFFILFKSIKKIGIFLSSFFIFFVLASSVQAAYCGGFNFNDNTGSCNTGSIFVDKGIDKQTKCYNWSCITPTSEEICTPYCFPDDQTVNCGNGVLEAGEQCDGNVFLWNIKGCSSWMQDLLNTKEIVCDANCRRDLKPCKNIKIDPPVSICGDGVVDKKAGEECDGNDLSEETCDSVVPGTDGILGCNANCTFNTDNCVGPCEKQVTSPFMPLSDFSPLCCNSLINNKFVQVAPDIKQLCSYDKVNLIGGTQQPAKLKHNSLRHYDYWEWNCTGKKKCIAYAGARCKTKLGQNVTGSNVCSNNNVNLDISTGVLNEEDFFNYIKNPQDQLSKNGAYCDSGRYVEINTNSCTDVWKNNHKAWKCVVDATASGIGSVSKKDEVTCLAGWNPGPMCNPVLSTTTLATDTCEQKEKKAISKIFDSREDFLGVFGEPTDKTEIDQAYCRVGTYKKDPTTDSCGVDWNSSYKSWICEDKVTKEEVSCTAAWKVTPSCWQTVGEEGFSDGIAQYTNVAFNKADKMPYVAYAVSGRGVYVKYFKDSGWQDISKNRPSGTENVHWVSFTFDNNNVPYVAYVTYIQKKDDVKDLNKGLLHVEKFVNGSWQEVGGVKNSSVVYSLYNGNYIPKNIDDIHKGGFTQMKEIRIVFDSKNQPYVVFAYLPGSSQIEYQGGAGYVTRVVTYDSKGWHELGVFYNDLKTEGYTFSSSPDIAVNKDDEVFVSFFSSPSFSSAGNSKVGLAYYDKANDRWTGVKEITYTSSWNKHTTYLVFHDNARFPNVYTTEWQPMCNRTDSSIIYTHILNYNGSWEQRAIAEDNEDIFYNSSSNAGRYGNGSVPSAEKEYQAFTKNYTDNIFGVYLRKDAKDYFYTYDYSRGKAIKEKTGWIWPTVCDADFSNGLATHVGTAVNPDVSNVKDYNKLYVSYSDSTKGGRITVKRAIR